MRPGDRIELLKRLAARLASDEDDQEWTELDLVLRQFGFPTSETWHSGGKRDYALAHLESGSDDALVELDRYLFGADSQPDPDPADVPWEPGTFRLFVSHTSANAGLAGDISRYFGRWRLDAFVAHQTIEPTKEWERVIDAALRTCDAMAVLVTPDLLNSKWCDQEVGYALHRQVPIVPVRLGADPHGFIAKFQGATPVLASEAAWIADSIFRALAQNAALRAAMAAPVVHRFAASTNVEGTRSNFELLAEVQEDAWTRDLVDIAARSIRENRQIAEAQVEGPERVRPAPEALEDLLKPIRERLGISLTPEPTMDDDIPF